MYWCNLEGRVCDISLHGQTPVEFDLLSAGVCMRGVETVKTEQKALKRASKGNPHAHSDALFLQAQNWLRWGFWPCSLSELGLCLQVCPCNISNLDRQIGFHSFVL